MNTSFLSPRDASVFINELYDLYIMLLDHT